MATEAVTESTPKASKLSDAEYRKWATNLIGKDWEIFWQEEEDREEECNNEEESKDPSQKDPDQQQHKSEPALDATPVATTTASTTASGQETAQEESKDDMPPNTEMQIDDVDLVQDTGEVITKPMESEEKNAAETSKGKNDKPTNENDDDDDDESSQGSIIDDWYDGHVLGIIQDDDSMHDTSIDDHSMPIGKNGWKFRVTFLGDEETYEVFLMPNKVRPSARGWVQRSIALLNPTAADEEKSDFPPDLPPDTSTLDDQQFLDSLKSKIFQSSSEEAPSLPAFLPPFLPAYNSFRRIQTLLFHLESQVHLRKKLSKIENHAGKELFTDGVRNPTENYVNHLVRCCKDLARACEWYTKSWKLLVYYFGNGAQDSDLAKLSFEELIRDYLDFGKNTIIHAAMIDTSAIGPSNKRRQAIAPEPTASGSRRTKRRKKTTNAFTEEEINETITKLLAASSKLETEILDKRHVDAFVKTITESIHYPHIAMLGTMLQSLSQFVVDPLARWKNQARRILGNNQKDDDDDALILMIDRIHTNTKDSNEPSSSDTEDEEADQFFSDVEIKACLSHTKNNNVLSRFELSDEVQKLHAKLGDIQRNEAKALALLNDLASVSTASSQEKKYDPSQDKVISGLRAILDEMDSPGSTLYNVDPLSTKTSSSVLTREHISKAIELRSWIVGVEHVQSVRERNVFCQRLISKIDQLPNVKEIQLLANVPQLLQRQEALIQNVLKLQADIKSFTGIVEKRERDLLAALSSIDISKRSDLESHLAFLQSLLIESNECPVIFSIEEKIAARVDLIIWYDRANTMLGPAYAEGKNLLSFSDLKNLHEHLQKVLRGFASTRATLVADVEQDSEANDDTSNFLAKDGAFDCKLAINEVTKLYDSSSSWKQRAESVIMALRTHGNPNAGEAVTSPKLPAMVDIKRIVDLTTEYPGLKVDVPGYFEKLEPIQSEACQWSENLCSMLMDDQVSFADALSFIRRERGQRPKGIIIYPSRTVVDSTVDFLDWYMKLKNVIEAMAGALKQSSNEYGRQKTSLFFSELISKDFYPILADGSEALEIYCNSRTESIEALDKYKYDSNRSNEILEQRFHIRKTVKALSREKINSNDIVSSLLSRMISKDFKEGYPLRLLLWIHWHVFVADFVSQDESDEDSKFHRKQVRSLVQATKIKASNPFLSDNIGLLDASDTQFLIQTKSTELIELDRLIDEAQQVETAIKKGLASAKELLRGSILEKADRVKEHLATLKTLLSTVKARLLGNEGLAMNGAFENPLERHIKYFSWLVRTLQYPVLHQAEASYSSCEVNQKKIPLNALVTIHERIPSEITEFGDPILCILRVRELYTEANKWQDEVSRTTLISNRGNKRRGTKEESKQQEMNESETDAKLRMRKMEMLAEAQILSKVDMPRYKAVKAMVDAKKELETQLENFLAQDFDGTSTNHDNAPLPKGDSLVGRNGEFILYRLTGSSLFSMMLTSMQSLATISDKVFALTRSKATFEWMRSAVNWIDDLQDAVATQSKFTNACEKLLVVPLEDAKRLCISGENIFLQTNKDVTQILSNHGIYASVNSITKRLNVRLKKDGAHHSIGGIVLRWCPILFDAIRADVVKLDLWENGLKKIVDSFNAFATKSYDENTTKENLYQWYRYYTEVKRAMEEGQNDLVVSPAKVTIDSFNHLLGTMRDHLEKNCTIDMIQEFSERPFTSSASLYDNRFGLLDALLYRQNTADNLGIDVEETNIRALESKECFRDVCRSDFQNALWKAAWVLNMEPKEVSLLEDLCALKAWEIESELFDMFQEENADTIPEGYRTKARTLKSNLENKKNVTLCLEVLSNDIQVDTLVNMTVDQYASRILKIEKEREKQAALKEEQMASGGDGKPCQSSTGILRKNTYLYDVFTQVDQNLDSDGAPTLDSDEEETYSKSSFTTTRLVESSSRSPSPPPPPLASSFDPHGEENRNLSTTAVFPITTNNGGEDFRMEIQGQIKYSFSVKFYREDTSQANVSGFIPESLVQMGRSKINDFDKFLSEKLRGGRWQAICLRLATNGDRDANIYDAFCNDFEAKKRIAMFKINETGGKLFLVTPKFHHVARRTRGISFGTKNSAYAVVLTKKDD